MCIRDRDWVGGDVELQLLDVSKDTLGASESDEDEGDDPENNERELDFIIQKIKEIYAAKKQVQNPDGTFRQIEWRDFAILRRSLAVSYTHLDVYKRQMQKYNK